MNSELRIPLKKVALVLAGAIIFFQVAGLGVNLAKYVAGKVRLLGLIPLFSLTNEVSIPNWFSSFQILTCAGLLAVIGREKARRDDPFARHWLFLSGLFVLMSIDETARLHETFGAFMGGFIKLGGFLSDLWVIPGTILVAIVGWRYRPFLRHLGRPTRRLCLISGGIYLTGVLVVDMIEVYYLVTTGGQDLIYGLIGQFEELLEMSGIALFIGTLLDYLARTGSRMVTVIGWSGESPAD